MFIHPNIIPQDTRLWLAREIKPRIIVENSKDIPSNLAQYLNNASCLDNNYQVVVKLHKKKSFGSHITLGCYQGKSGIIGRGQKTHKQTSVMTSDECCKFHLHVYYDNEEERFYVRKNSGVSFEHNNHPPIHRDHMSTGKKLYPTSIEKPPKRCLKKLSYIFC